MITIIIRKEKCANDNYSQRFFLNVLSTELFCTHAIRKL